MQIQPPSRRWSLGLPPFDCGLCMVTSFQRVQHAKEEERVALQRRNLANTTSARWSRLTPKLVNHVDTLYLWYLWWEWHLPLCLPPKIALPQSNHEKKNQTSPTFCKIPDQYSSPTAKVIKNKQSLRNCHSQEETKEIWWLNVMWYPGWNPGTEKGY